MGIERLTCEQKKTSEDLSATRDKLHSVQSERNELDGEKSSLVESMRLLNIQLNRTTVERETLFRKVEERDDRIATVTKELERLGLDSGAQVAKLQSELEAARKEVAECRAAWEKEQAWADKLLVALDVNETKIQRLSEEEANLKVDLQKEKDLLSKKIDDLKDEQASRKWAEGEIAQLKETLHKKEQQAQLSNHQWLDEKCGLEASIQHLKNQMGVDRDHFEHELKNRETRLRLMTDTVDQVRVAFANSAKELSEKHQEAASGRPVPS